MIAIFFRESTFVVDIGIAMVFAALFTGLFSRRFIRQENWMGLAGFFAVLFLVSWLGGLWIRPVGRPVWGVYWLPFFFSSLAFALLLAAAPYLDPPRSREEAVERVQEREGLAKAVGFAFWLLVILMILLIGVRYARMVLDQGLHPIGIRPSTLAVEDHPPGRDALRRGAQRGGPAGG